jgi:transcription elongation GreA/GreB family factor
MTTSTAPEERIVSLGSRVVLDDLDDGTREEYTVVLSAESNASAGRISNESPVGRAIEGHRRGDVVDAHAPRRTRHLRIADVRREHLAAREPTDQSSARTTQGADLR